MTDTDGSLRERDEGELMQLVTAMGAALPTPDLTARMLAALAPRLETTVAERAAMATNGGPLAIVDPKKREQELVIELADLAKLGAGQLPASEDKTLEQDIRAWLTKLEQAEVGQLLPRLAATVQAASGDPRLAWPAVSPTAVPLLDGFIAMLERGWALPKFDGRPVDPATLARQIDDARALLEGGSPPPPGLLAPAEGAALDAFPRTTELKWSAVPGAAGYLVEVEYCEDAECVTSRPLTSVRTSGTEFTFDFVGMQTGRWRVRAVSTDGSAGPPSGWRAFTYTV